MSNLGLHIEGLTVRFGGLLAVDNVTLTAPAGTITGLIGPNGAGKTTTFNACTGTVRAASGTVRLFDHDLSHLGPASRARAGLGRTFQRMELFDSMTVSRNVSVGIEAGFAGRRLWSHLICPPHQRREIAERTEVVLAECGLIDLAHLRVRDLSTGQRRLVELARALGSGFRFLLLDEPSSGLDKRETERFAEIITSAVQSDLGILLVEHDMSLVRRVCRYVYVLDFGELIFEGSMEEVENSEAVRDAYLGSMAG